MDLTTCQNPTLLSNIRPTFFGTPRESNEIAPFGKFACLHLIDSNKHEKHATHLHHYIIYVSSYNVQRGKRELFWFTKKKNKQESPAVLSDVWCFWRVMQIICYTVARAVGSIRANAQLHGAPKALKALGLTKLFFIEK